MWLLLLVLLLKAGWFAPSESKETTIREAYEVGERALQQGDLAKAEKSFLKVLELVPRDVGARVNLGVLFMREQNWTRALEYLNQAEKLAPQVTGIRLNIGLVHYRQGDYAGAIPQFESVLREDAFSEQARRLLGLCYLFEARYSDAAQMLEPLWPVSNGDLSYLYSLAVAAGQGGRPELEERALTKLMEAGKDSPLVHLLLGKAYMAHGDYEHALTELQTAREGDAKLPLLHYNLGLAYRHNGETEKARTEFLQDAALEPKVAFNYDQLGLLASLEGKDHEAEGYFAEAVKRDRSLGTSWFGLAKMYRQDKRYSEALKALDEAGTIDPQSASVHYLRAQILAALGRKSESQTEMATVQRLKKETVDKLEQEISGATYRDREMPVQ
jgi:tetratricopeptide (TPR) repeat protein